MRSAMATPGRSADRAGHARKPPWPGGAFDGGREGGCMRVALIDPALFTWPYDAALADGLEAAGHQVAIFGKVVGGPTHPGHDRRLCQHFYGALERRPFTALPGPLRLAAKGVSHVAGWARLAEELRA